VVLLPLLFLRRGGSECERLRARGAGVRGVAPRWILAGYIPREIGSNGPIPLCGEVAERLKAAVLKVESLRIDE